MLKKIRRWWAGELISPDDDPDSPIVFLPYQKRPAVVRYLEALRRFYKMHWQWLWSTAIGFGSLLVGILALR
jgi:hypothetical protein